jgi:hypothetical protein
MRTACLWTVLSKPARKYCLSTQQASESRNALGLLQGRMNNYCKQVHASKCAETHQPQACKNSSKEYANKARMHSYFNFPRLGLLGTQLARATSTRCKN